MGRARILVAHAAGRRGGLCPGRACCELHRPVTLDRLALASAYRLVLNIEAFGHPGRRRPGGRRGKAVRRHDHGVGHCRRDARGCVAQRLGGSLPRFDIDRGCRVDVVEALDAARGVGGAAHVPGV